MRRYIYFWAAISVALLLGLGAHPGQVHSEPNIVTQTADTASTLSIEAEGMSGSGKVFRDKTASEHKGRVFYKKGSVSDQFVGAAGEIVVRAKGSRVRAKGSRCKRAPRMTVTVDGIKEMSRSVRAKKKWAYYGGSVNVPQGEHTISIKSVNARKTRKCKRNLRVDKITVGFYSLPITITKGGTYSGNWQSLDPNVPAVLITTTEPVTIENSAIRSRSDLIKATGKTDVTVRNSEGYGLNPNVAGRAPGRFFASELFVNARLENNYLEGTRGIYLLDYRGNGTPSQTVKILRNRAKNIDGRHSDGAGGFSQTGFSIAQFAQFDKVRQIRGVEIAWNEVVNEPGKSRVEDNINIYLSSGTSDSPILIRDNYIQGGYPTDPTKDGHSGGGILLGDGSSSSVEGAAAFVKGFGNQVVSTTNYGIAIAGGHDNELYDNRVVSSGYLEDGSWIAAQNVGAYIWDIYDAGEKTPSTFYNNVIRDNAIGWVRKDSTGLIVRNDWWVPDCAKAPNGTSLCTGNEHWIAPLTREVEAAEYRYWQDKLSTQGVTVGTQQL